MACSNRPDYFIDLDEPIDPNKRLGAGAYGAVYEVKLNGASCIAKRLHDILTGARGEARVSDQEMRAIVTKFRNECSLLSKMRHSNVVQFLGINQTTPDPRDMALIMEKLHMDLEHLITHYKEVLAPTSIPATSSNDVFLSIKVHILRDISCGLLHIHSHGVVHRDLNAGNVLLTENLQAKVADLGVARIIKKSAVGKLSVAPGATDYMPPEALSDDPIYDNTLDAFSLGHLMLYLINCRYPQPQDPSLRRVTVSAKKSGLPFGMQAQKRKRWLDHISEEYALCKIVVHCLQDEPNDRPTMSDLRASLHKLCELFPKSIDTVSKLMNKRRENTDKIIERLKSEKERAELHHNDEVTKLKTTIKELEDYNKQMKTQVDVLKAQVQNAELRAQSALDSKQHLLAAFQQEQKKVTELQGALFSQMKTMEIENSKIHNANKIIAEKLKASNDQLSKLTPIQVQSSSHLHSSIQIARPTVGDTYYAPKRNDVWSPEVSPHPNVPFEGHETYSFTQDDQVTNQGGTQFVVNPSDNIPKQLSSQAAMVSTNQSQYKEELSGGYAAPQMTAAQMQQFAIHAQKQREQAILNQQEEERLRLLEQKRKYMLADQALQELERAEKERVKKQGTHQPNPISQATPTSSHLESQNNTVGQMVRGAPEVIDDARKSEDIPENELLENIDQDIQYYANQVRDMTKRPTTAKVDDHSSLPYDPNLVCHKCGKRYHIGERQKFKRHIKETCPNKK